MAFSHRLTPLCMQPLVMCSVQSHTLFTVPVDSCTRGIMEVPHLKGDQQPPHIYAYHTLNHTSEIWNFAQMRLFDCEVYMHSPELVWNRKRRGRRCGDLTLCVLIVVFVTMILTKSATDAQMARIKGWRKGGVSPGAEFSIYSRFQICTNVLPS